MLELLSSASLPLLVVALLAAGVGVPLPEDLLVLTAGVVAHRSGYPSWLVLPVVYVAAITADCGLFLLTRRFGEPLVARAPFRWLVTPRRRERVSRLFARYGAYAVFVGRHLPGVRPMVFILAGLERMSFPRFLLWDALAGLVTVPTLFSLGYFFSTHVDAVAHGVARVEHWVGFVLAIIALVAWLLWSRRPASPPRTGG